MAKWNRKDWREAIDTLRTLCPLPTQVSVTRVPLPDGDLGDCEKRRGRFYIRISNEIPTDFAIWVLIHEWAHAMVWPLYKRRDRDHTSHFGIAWAEAYRAIYHEYH